MNWLSYKIIVVMAVLSVGMLEIRTVFPVSGAEDHDVIIGPMQEVEMIINPSPTATIEVQTIQPVVESPIQVRLNITNNSDHELVIVNPAVGFPPTDMHWTASNEAYQIAVLMSVGFIKVTLKNVNNQPVESKGLMPWVTPIVGKKVLQPYENVAIDFDLNELFLIASAGSYTLSIRYGNDTVYADANVEIEIR